MRWFSKEDNGQQLIAARQMLKSAKEAHTQKRYAEALGQCAQAAGIAERLGETADDVRYAALYSMATPFWNDS